MNFSSFINPLKQQKVSVCICLIHSSVETTDPNEQKFCEMISPRMQMVLGWKTSRFGHPFAENLAILEII